MTDKQIIIKGLEKIEKYLDETESALDIANDYMQELLCDLKINDEVSDFILDLVENENIPEDIRNKAGELWRKI